VGVSELRYRHRFDILADIVRVAGPGVKKTRIMYFANLSYDLLKRYLAEAVHLGFVRASNGEYAITQKGEMFLERYNALNNKSGQIRADLEGLRCEAEQLERMCQLRRRGGNTRSFRRSRFAALG
jgi:predicted transcriptional regulator